MGDRPWWVHALQGGLSALAISLVLGWLGRSRTRGANRVRDRIVLRNPRSVLVLALASGAFFLAVGAMTVLALKGLNLWPLLSVFAAFELLAVWMLVDYFLERFELSDTGLEFRTTFGGAGSVLWSDIVAVEYSQAMKWFRLVLRNGRVVRISFMLSDLPEFARALLERASSARVDASTRAVLEQTARGDVPPLHG